MPDLYDSLLLPIIVAIVGAVVSGVILAALKKKSPKIVASCYKSGWYRRTQTSTHTNVVIFLKFENKTDSVTTVKDCTLKVEYEGKTHGPYPSESLNIEMTPRRAIDKRVEFMVPISDVDIKHNIDRVIVITNYIPKSSKIEVTDIPNMVV